MKATKDHCVGCRESFRNAGVGECWSLKVATVVRMVRRRLDAPAGDARSYQPVHVPRCFSAVGVVHLDEVPEYAR